MKVYPLITGRRVDLSKLSIEEKELLGVVREQYQRKPAWSKFGSFWVSKFNEARLDESSPVYRVCQDLEARLGIAQGKVALPNYRDYLVDLIEEKYDSRYRFCKETGVDQGHLSRVLAGRAELSVQFLEKILRSLDSSLVIKPCDEIRADAELKKANDVLVEVVRDLHENRAFAASSHLRM